MEEELRGVGQAMAGLGDAVVAVLGERGAAREMKSLQQAIDNVQDKRYVFSSHQLGFIVSRHTMRVCSTLDRALPLLWEYSGVLWRVRPFEIKHAVRCLLFTHDDGMFGLSCSTEQHVIASLRHMGPDSVLAMSITP